ncbi:MAG TPA: ATP-binding cassette domain-containing protein [Steroidobacteraceae bacterium]|jgi:ATP-binding cassette subfamily F protein uup|nr:ATP-binding cassette domain-containing protein [Steroidobacteraceae bacterium]
MPLVTLLDGQLAFGDHPLLDRAQLSVEAGERIGLIGRNGSGKSSLLRVLAGVAALDVGELQHRNGLRRAWVEQEPQLPSAATLRASLHARASALAAMQAGAARAAGADEREVWRRDSRLAEFLQRFDLDGEQAPDVSSGGECKRAALALAFAQQPELLLLDEPTNHLDISGIERLEELLRKVPTAIFITHDRAFLDAVATRIVELDRGVLRSYAGNFAAYEARKEADIASEGIAARRFEKFWQQEEAWIRKGVEARRTRDMGRVRRLQRLRSARAARRERLGDLRLSLDSGEASGQLVAELCEVSKRFAERTLIERLSMRIMRQDRIGLIGANGAGKSTLIRLILGTLAPDSGSVRRGTNLRVAYFDQLREQLDPNRSVADTISPGSDWIEIDGERKHIMSYLADFLFPTQRAQSPVRMLSGGERNRLLLARLFARPANLLVLDEPTNDLDIESLELLEQRLQDYDGTLILVSHDRKFLDNVITQTLAAELNGQWREYVGGYSDWLQQRPAPAATAAAPAKLAATRPKARTKLSYKDERELAALPTLIEALEREQADVTARMSLPDYHRRAPEELRNDRQRIVAIEAQLQEKFTRWEALEKAARSLDR